MNCSFILFCLASILATISGNKILSERSCPTLKTSETLDLTLNLRGGEVLEPTTLSDVETIIMKASNDGKLVVIDFSAT